MLICEHTPLTFPNSDTGSEQQSDTCLTLPFAAGQWDRDSRAEMNHSEQTEAYQVGCAVRKREGPGNALDLV